MGNSSSKIKSVKFGKEIITQNENEVLECDWSGLPYKMETCMVDNVVTQARTNFGTNVTSVCIFVLTVFL
jgi:hypothetical protein